MAEIYLKSLDDGGNIKIPIGKTVIGRGPLLNCADKKVSRNHALLEVSEDGSATITPTHINPCFYQVQADGHTQVLKKNVPQKLASGDIISLLPHTFRYRIEIKNDSIEEKVQTKPHSEPDIGNKENSSEPQNNAENKSDAPPIKSLDDEDKLNKEKEYDFNLEENSKSESPKSQTLKVSNSKIDTCAEITQNSTPQKTNDIDTPQNSIKPNRSRKRNLPDWLSSPSKNEKEVKKGPGRPGRPPKNQSAKKESSLDSIQTKENKNTTEVTLSTGRSSRKIKTSTSISLDDFIVSDDDFENEFQDSGSDWECEFKIKSKKKKVGSESGSDWEMENRSSRKGKKKYRSSESGSDWEAEKRKHIKKKVRQKKKHESEEGESESDWETKYSSRSSTHKRSTRQSSRTSTSTTKRTPCTFGKNCYRKNPSHIKEHSHPGDSDYISGDERQSDDKPECKYGSKCVRKNPQHKQDFKHPEQTEKEDETEDQESVKKEEDKESEKA